MTRPFLGDSVLVPTNEKQLLDEIAELAAVVLEGKNRTGLYEKGMHPRDVLQLRLLDLQILRAR